MNALPVGDLSSVSCHGCNVYDASLRHSSHPKVVSMLVAANQSARVGIWCARCRGMEALKATAVSLLAGWWSPRGPKLTLDAIRKNLRGGEQSASTNAQLLRGIARTEYDNGNPELASMFAAAAHSVQPQRENSRLMDDLRRGGYRSSVSSSPWRFAAWAPIVAAVFVVAVVGLSMLPDDEAEAEPAAVVQRAAAVPSKAVAMQTEVDAERAAADWLRARLRVMQSDVTPRLRRGDDLWTMIDEVKALRKGPGVAELLKKNTSYDSSLTQLVEKLQHATRYYRGGAPVDAIERTAGESLQVTADVAFDAVVADIFGDKGTRDALVSEVDARADGIVAMRQELRFRAAVISYTTKAFAECMQVIEPTIR